MTNESLLIEQVIRLEALVANQGNEIERLKKEAELAIVDPLTSLPNRRAFDRAFERIVSGLRRDKGRRRNGHVKSVSILFIDVDKFKFINDNFGHETGDRVLVVIASVLNECFPREGDLVSRIAGDEFAVILVGMTEENLNRSVQKLKSAVNKADYGLGEELKVSVSVGTALATNQTEAEGLLTIADKAMYKDKGIT